MSRIVKGSVPHEHWGKVFFVTMKQPYAGEDNNGSTTVVRCKKCNLFCSTQKVIMNPGLACYHCDYTGYE